ncbi:MAG: ATP phosphoribosyltransferase [Myxococcota bacterium]|nr:ATP phosphoribosyltransferase [Myxococcota bacterium]
MTEPSSQLLRVALPKGRLAEEAVRLFAMRGYDFSPALAESRRLIFDIPSCGCQVFMVKPMDVPVYVERGVCDAGVAGSDTLMELGPDVYEPLDLGIGLCRISLAGIAGARFDPYRGPIRIATKFHNIAKRWCLRKGFAHEIVSLSGSLELAPLTGLAPWIVDIIQTGETLRQNGLMEVETIAPVQARLAVNRASMKLKLKPIEAMISALSPDPAAGSSTPAGTA